AAGDCATEVHGPEHGAGSGVEREEMSLASAREEQVRSSRQDAALRVIDHLEIPLLLAGLRIDRANRAVPFVLRPVRRRSGTFGAGRRRRAARVLAALAPRRYIRFHRQRGVVVPHGDVEQSRPRAEGWGVPVRAALRAWKDERPFGARL